MSRTYKATGINLKAMPLGEADRLVTILTREYGLIRVVAPGARKQNSKLGGRSSLFVVNELLLAKGRSLDKITQAETLETYPGLSKDLSKLAASQYLAELVLCHALSEHPQEELYALLNEHLRRLEELPSTSGELGVSAVLAHLSHGIFHLLALAGIAPQVQVCCITQHALNPDYSNPDWRVGFSVDAGGTVSLTPDASGQWQPRRATSEGQSAEAAALALVKPGERSLAKQDDNARQEVMRSHYSIGVRADAIAPSRDEDVQISPPPRINTKLDAMELTLLQTLGEAELPQPNSGLPNQQGWLSPPESVHQAWVKLEKILREYAQYHFGRSIRSAALVDALSNSYL
ncbi:MAG TPA: DNA repair protein RecO [Allocoleopsis sp.]